MNILMITENDPAGMGIAFTNAINRFSKNRCRLITTKTKYDFFFEKDIHVPDLDNDGFDEIVQLIKDADIIHFHILADETIELGPVKVKDYVTGKKILHHHHGHPQFRSNPDFYRKKYKQLKRKALVSTPDLLLLLPEARWQPNLVPINDPLYQPKDNNSNNPIRIGQAPTRKDLKNTTEFLNVTAKLKRKLTQKDIEVDVIENVSNKECLKRKSTCHIIFDHMQGYYGVSSLESLSHGKPVVAGLNEWNIKHIKEFTRANKLPWIIARNQEELEDKLEELINEDESRKNTGTESRKFMEKHWSEPDVLKNLDEVYETL